MITLYTFGPAFGLPDMSPFVTKAEMLLKLAGLDYRTDSNGFSKAPKGKLPYIDDDGDVDGADFLLWQRGESPNDGSPADLADWEAYYGTTGGLEAASARAKSFTRALICPTRTF